VTATEDAQLIAEVENAKANLRTSLKKSKALIAAYRQRMARPSAPKSEADPKDKPLFRFKR
jgi:hypothetical protein